MGRPKGRRNSDYDQRRSSLAAAVVPELLSTASLPSMRRLAEVAGCSVPTLRHYFDTPEGVAEAALVLMHSFGKPHLARTECSELGPLEPSLRWFLSEFRLGWERGVGRMLAIGIELGLNDDQLGPAFVNELLEPTLQAVEKRLAWHRDQGHLVPCDLRIAALNLLSPIFMGLLHQGPLGGDRCRPLDVDAFLEAQLQAFLRAFAANDGQEQGPPSSRA